MIKIICLGKIKEKYLEDFIDDYYNRIKKYHKIEIIELKDNNDIEKESKDVMKYLNNKDYKIALCIDGKNYSSVNLSKHIDDLFNNYGTITFIIGASNGLSDEVINLCDEKISFSLQTFPHGVFRGLLLEQLYRSFKILNNESYHK